MSLPWKPLTAPGPWRRQIRVLARAFHDAAPARIARDVHHGAKVHLTPDAAVSAAAMAPRARPSRAPSPGLGQRHGEDGPVAVDGVVGEEDGILRRDSSAAFCRAFVLTARARSRSSREGPFAPTRRAPAAGPRSLCRELLELAKLLFERHLASKTSMRRSTAWSWPERGPGGEQQRRKTIHSFFVMAFLYTRPAVHHPAADPRAAPGRRASVIVSPIRRSAPFTFTREGFRGTP